MVTYVFEEPSDSILLPTEVEAAAIISKCSQVFSLEMFTFQTLIQKSEGRRPFKTPRHILQDNIKMDIEEIGYE
jgi:hypothetical protein